ncbi:MAG: tRNA 2-thiocytidine(32) synthetase TtcA [Spirochaetes bacterium]|nr:tRNA 2-thiocytidine(32) synthetase TtcA [Spirochaetota bacterium]
MDKYHYIDKIRKKIGKTIYEYELIKNSDRIAVALSGGIDSLVLLETLVVREKYIPISYEVTAIHVVMRNGPYSADVNALKRFCANLNVELHCVEMNFSIVNEKKSTCTSCAFLRRKALFDWMKKQSFQCLAFGHHMDDAIETLLLNMVFQGNFSTMPPKLSLFNGEFTIIRPLIHCTKKEIEHYASYLNITPCATSCCHAHATNRARMKTIVEKLTAMHPHARHNIFAAMSNIRTEYLP